MVLPCAKRNTLRHCNTLFRNWNTLGSYRFIVSTFVGLDIASVLMGFKDTRFFLFSMYIDANW